MRKLPKLFQLVISEMPNLVPCESVGVFVMIPNLIINRQLTEYKLQIQKSMLDGKSFDVINPMQEDMPEPKFKKIKDASSAMRTNMFML